MKKWLMVIALTAAATAGLMVVFKDRWFVDNQAFRIASVPLMDLAGAQATLQPGRPGYVVFYSDLEACTACVRKLAHLQALSETYPDVGFYAIMRSASYKDAFVAQMREHLVPGEYLIDDSQRIAKQMGLSDHSHLMFFDRRERLIAIMAMTVDHDGLVKQYHRYIAEM